MNLKWTISSSILRSSPRLTGTRILTIPERTTVTATQVSDDGFWSFIHYRNYQGWTYSALLDSVRVPPFEPPIHIPVVSVPENMHKPGRPAQYLVIDGKEKFNLCGQFCAAEIANLNILDFLRAWKAEHYIAYTLHVGSDRGTGSSTMRGMLETIGRSNIQDFNKPLIHPIAGLLLSPARIGALLDTGAELTLGVTIDSTGRIITSKGISHWVNILSVVPFGVFDGEVELYNPFNNQNETVSWGTVYNSAKVWGGITGLWSF